MLYFLYGESSYHALRKISDFKNAFKKKSADFLIEDFDGETEELSFGQFHASLGQQNLFSGTRLVIYRNVLGEDEKLFEELVNNADYFKSIKDVFVFWEREPETKTLNFFKKYSEKTQEIKDVTDVELDKFYGNASKQEKKHGPAPTPFAFIDKMFGPRAPLALKEMSLAGIEPQKFIYAFLWKLKQKSAQGGPASGWPDAYFAGIEAESQMRRDPKNAEEILEQFIFSLPDRQAGIKA
ncbi:hypothetical protein A2662_02215 [Candidatus Giovannonibacteria bacterium RIFCSPHIGHO2_01_FULL_45_33]|uniref:DNA polymerase III delta N-terminal domain-containing protein n=1 Tax=Candidatus Giovannonibacteria bacterium RIFCSPLOWO2_01_FULL_45_34 TaxID=1798351 RepID=A0A1F5WZ62_9BACT|nr:MAG: hypothetical protein A2662_02215 [Candidatus Giovannonibacteria bacterium RIFCSPHIGHO2_01_FULL_45_33]OGF69382.1 MAG: hypothetical protein A3C73_02765 [Candidatus Giovannonibacteria bacterium RIFCSPHIGHO2_02_FULL_44_11]OGF80909.1 MAG: hypothetical protein A2930_04200 [Candidatus Giovannonibacteria bacterium RIFCSPLOWO2_01_FULL_45_34]